MSNELQDKFIYLNKFAILI